ncbi:MAG: hypothetical protein J6Q51_00115 [Clostridia bacterium]|nr:hypothetical protein [Clostridia bacterium]
MKLIKCYIENFGKLHNFEFNFSNGLNSIKEENGWGKTTFATFIKSMFYGLPSTTKRNLDENERKKYSPWQGGAFGGNIEFEVNNKKYRVERFFGKNNSEDTFDIIDLSTGKKSKDYSQNIGQELFDLDEDAFERSCFIPQKILNSNINESISNKLTNLIHGTIENYNYELAQENLDKKRSTLHNKKGSGQIQETESKIEDLISKINELNTSALAISELQNQVDIQEEQIKQLLNKQSIIKSQIKEYSKTQQKVANKDLYTKLVNQVEQTKNQITENQEILNNKITSITEITAYETLNQKTIQSQNELEIKSKNNYLQDRHNELLNYFGGENKIPSSKEISQITQDISTYNSLKISTANIEQTKKTPAKKSKLNLIFAGVSALALLGGAIALAYITILGIICFVIGVVSLCIAGFSYLSNMINVKTSTNNNIDYNQLEKDQNEKFRLQKTINEFLCNYEGYNTDINTALSNIVANKKEYENITQKLNVQKTENTKLTNNINKDKQKIQQYLLQFNVDNNISFGEQLSILKQSLINISNLKELLVKEQEELDLFKKEKNFDTSELSLENIDIDDLQNLDKQLQNEIDECRDFKSRNIAKINRIQDEISALDDLENEKEILENDLQKLNSELNAVKNAIKFLEEANESLSAKFLEPMKNGLTKYLKLITNKDFNNLKLDTDFNILFEEYGKLREVNYYSKGYKNTIDLCMRLALIDALFENQKPFIVLDDPFVNMDESKVENAKQFLQELSKTYQLIYFSCHNSRC